MEFLKKHNILQILSRSYLYYRAPNEFNNTTVRMGLDDSKWDRLCLVWVNMLETVQKGMIFFSTEYGISVYTAHKNKKVYIINLENWGFQFKRAPEESVYVFSIRNHLYFHCSSSDLQGAVCQDITLHSVRMYQNFQSAWTWCPPRWDVISKDRTGELHRGIGVVGTFYSLL